MVPPASILIYKYMVLKHRVSVRSNWFAHHSALMTKQMHFRGMETTEAGLTSLALQCTMLDHLWPRTLQKAYSICVACDRNIYYIIEQDDGTWTSGTIISDGSIGVFSFSEDRDVRVARNGLVSLEMMPAKVLTSFLCGMWCTTTAHYSKETYIRKYALMLHPRSYSEATWYMIIDHVRFNRPPHSILTHFFVNTLMTVLSVAHMFRRFRGNSSWSIATTTYFICPVAISAKVIMFTTSISPLVRICFRGWDPDDRKLLTIIHGSYSCFLDRKSNTVSALGFPSRFRPLAIISFFIDAEPWSVGGQFKYGVS